jgi:hypothetical protein
MLLIDLFLKDIKLVPRIKHPKIGGDENIGDNDSNNVEAHTNNIIEDFVSKNTSRWIFFSGR